MSEPTKIKFDFKRFTRSSKQLEAQDGQDAVQKNKKTKSAAAIKQARYRHKIASNPDKLNEIRNKEQGRHKLYRHKINEKRLQSKRLDEEYKKRQRERQAQYRQKKRKREESQRKREESQRKGEESQRKREKSQRKGNSRNMESKTKQRKSESSRKEVTRKKTAAIRKAASRLKTQMPQSPGRWVETVSHVIKNSTPRRKEALIEILNSDNKAGRSLKSVTDWKPGRPTKQNAAVKKALFSSLDKTGIQDKEILSQASRYKRYHTRKTSRDTKRQKKHQKWDKIVREYMLRDSVSRPMPNKRDVLKVGGQYVGKRLLLSTKRQVCEAFMQEFPEYPFKFTTFVKSVPREIKRMKLHHRRVCICVKDYNMEQKVNALNVICQKSPELISTVSDLSNMTLCSTPTWLKKPQCLERNCADCGISQITGHFEPLKEKLDTSNKTQKWLEWENLPSSYVSTKGIRVKTKCWQQVTKEDTIDNLIAKTAADMALHSAHLFRAVYQHHQEQVLAEHLPLDHAIMHVDFSQNLALVPQDECESAHFTQKQVTVHPVYLIRHGVGSTTEKPILWKQSIVQISDNLKHDGGAVFNFTEQVIHYMMNNPGAVARPTVIHRFSDNCAVQYKSKTTFEHLKLYKDLFDIDMHYHYSESGHGKGPSDGIGATIKHSLTMMVLQDQVVLNSAYDAYLVAHRKLRTWYEDGTVRRTILYLPASKMRQIKTDGGLKVPGTRELHTMFLTSNTLTYNNLTCVCQVCLGKIEGPCYYSQVRHKNKFIELPGIKVQEDVSEVTDHEKIEAEASVVEMDHDQNDTPNMDLQCQEWVAVIYDSNWWIGEVVAKVEDDKYKIKFMRPAGINKFIWPGKAEEDTLPGPEILCRVKTPHPVSRRHFGLDNDEYTRVQAMFSSLM